MPLPEVLESLPKKLNLLLTTGLLLVAAAGGVNFYSSLQQNSLKLPLTLEKEGKYSKWVNKWKERFPQVEADSFKKVDDGEIISSTNPRYKISDPSEDVVRSEVAKFEEQRFYVVAPNKLQYLAFRAFKDGVEDATKSEVYYYGIRGGKLLEGPIYECKKTKCWFDRPFFTTPDLFYLPEIQEKVNTIDPQQCSRDKICSYELFLHEFDLAGNNRNTYVLTNLLTDFDEIQEALNDL